MNVTESTNIIKIHSYLLTINELEVIDSEGRQSKVKSFTYDKQKQYNIIELNNWIPVGIGYQLSLSFNGSFVKKIIGFYKSKYKDSDNNTR